MPLRPRPGPPRLCRHRLSPAPDRPRQSRRSLQVRAVVPRHRHPMWPACRHQQPRSHLDRKTPAHPTPPGRFRRGRLSNVVITSRAGIRLWLSIGSGFTVALIGRSSTASVVGAASTAAAGTSPASPGSSVAGVVAAASSPSVDALSAIASACAGASAFWPSSLPACAAALPASFGLRSRAKTQRAVSTWPSSSGEQPRMDIISGE